MGTSHKPRRYFQSGRDTVRAINDGVSAFGANQLALVSHREMPSGAVMEPIMTPAAHKALVDIAHVLKETNAVSTGGAAGARGGMALAPPTVIRFMNSAARRDAPRPDARPVASRCLRIRLYVDENFP